jgi:hypothetical protein
LERVRSLYGNDVLLLDSSKTLPSLRFLVQHRETLGLGSEELFVILALKDVRSFCASVLRKRGARRSALSVVRTFRWWRAANRALLAEVERSGVAAYLSLYEHLCRAPEEQCERIATFLGVSAEAAGPAADRQAHIAIGNKDYLNQTRGRVRYDSRWFHDELVNACYQLMPATRRLNRRLHERSEAGRIPARD